MLREAARVWDELGERIGAAMMLMGAGELQRSRNDYESALRLYEETLALLRQLDRPQAIALCHSNLGLVANHQQDFGRARRHFTECLSLFREQEDPWGIALGLAGLAGCAIGQGQPERSARLLGARAGLLGDSQQRVDAVDLREFDRYQAAAQAALGHAAFEAAWAEGQGMTLDQAVDYALQDDDDV